MPYYRDMQPSYKKRLYRDWRSGQFTIEELAAKYARSVFKVNLIIEKERERYATK